ncbi:UNVERIFIED_ORG: hypothetical protein HNP28_000340 [Comamonas terrigena]
MQLLLTRDVYHGARTGGAAVALADECLIIAFAPNCKRLARIFCKYFSYPGQIGGCQREMQDKSKLFFKNKSCQRLSIHRFLMKSIGNEDFTSAQSSAF